ncbi:MAG: hypothetical protein Kow00122_11580 [Thermoleophilia bacterium]
MARVASIRWARVYSLRRRRLALLAAVVLGSLLVAASVAAPAGAAGRSDMFGLVSHVAYKDYAVSYGGDVDRELDLVAGAGARWIRLDLSWGWSEPKKGQFDQSYLTGLDSVVRKARARGLQILFVTDGSPYWANPKGVGYPPLDNQDYARWLTAMVDRYKDDVHHWEIWNEPNLPRFWGNAPNAAEYVELLRVSYAAVKAADPTATVVSAGLAQGGGALDPAQFLRDMYAAGLRGHFDALGFHPYSGTQGPEVWWEDYPKDTFQVTGKVIRPIMVANGDADKPIWITEFGYSTYAGTYGVTEAKQAEYLTQAYTIVRDQWPFVEVMFWYDARDDGRESTSFEQNMGITKFDYMPKAAYAAYKDMAAGTTTTASPTTTTTASPTTTTTAPPTTTTTAPPTTTTTAPPTTTTPSTTTTVVPPSQSSLPYVAFLKPEEAAVVKGRVSVVVEAAAGAGIRQVEVQIDGMRLGIDRSAPYTFTWDTKKVTPGSHTLMAVAYDKVGNVVATAITVKTIATTSGLNRTASAASAFNYAAGAANLVSTGVVFRD